MYARGTRSIYLTYKTHRKARRIPMSRMATRARAGTVHGRMRVVLHVGACLQDAHACAARDYLRAQQAEPKLPGCKLRPVDASDVTDGSHVSEPLVLREAMGQVVDHAACTY